METVWFLIIKDDGKEDILVFDKLSAVVGYIGYNRIQDYVIYWGKEV